MNTLMKIVMAVGVLILVGCGGGGGSPENPTDSPLVYSGKTSNAPLTKTNIPKFIEVFDISSIKEFVELYDSLPFEEIFAGKQDLSDTQNGAVSGKQTIKVHIVNNTTIQVTHTFDNYKDNDASMDGVVEDLVVYKSGIAYHQINIQHLVTTQNGIVGKLEGNINYSFEKGLKIEELIAQNTSFGQMLRYQDFSSLEKSDMMIYEGKVCLSQEGCIELSTTYNQNKVRSDVVTMLGKNKALLSRDYAKYLLVHLSALDQDDTYTYLVFDENMTQTVIPVYEANMTFGEYRFFEGQDILEESVQTIKISDLDNNGEEELMFLTTEDYQDCILHIIDRDDFEKNMTSTSYDILDKGYDLFFYLFNGNNDQKKDIFLPKSWNSELLIQNEDKSFSSSIIDIQNVVSPTRVFINDFNGDGIDDRAELNGCTLEIYTDITNDNHKVSIPLSNCGYTPDAIDYDPARLRLGDFNHDGIQDFFVLYTDERDPIYNGNNSYLIVINNGDGTVTELNSVEIIDYGEEDIIAGRGNTFAVGESILVFDANRDGYDDVVFRGKLLLNNKNNTLTKKVELSTTNGSFGGEEFLGIYDVNSDGIDDILFSGYLGIRAVLISEKYETKDILLIADGDARNATNVAIGHISKNNKLDIVRNYNNRIEVTSFR